MDETLRQVIGWEVAALVGLFGVVVLGLIVARKINLDKLVSEQNGDASLSRFQFLIFTFVIALSFFYVVANTGELPNIPGEVRALLGISGGSYVISKGIQAAKAPRTGSPEGPEEGPPPDM